MTDFLGVDQRLDQVGTRKDIKGQERIGKDIERTSKGQATDRLVLCHARQQATQ